MRHSLATLDRVALFGGQRYSVVIDTTGDAGKSFYFRSNMMLGCFSYLFHEFGDANPTALAIIRVPFANGSVPTGPVESKDWNKGSPNLGVCRDPDPKSMVPLVPVDAGPDVSGRGFFRTMAAPAVGVPRYRNGTGKLKTVDFYVNKCADVSFLCPLRTVDRCLFAV